MIDKRFWPSFLPLLTNVALTQLVAQIDIVMAARTGVGAPAAYASMLRVAVLDIVATMAIGTLAAIFVARAAERGRAADVLGPVATFALVSGASFGLLGAYLYPAVIARIGADPVTTEFVAQAVIWFALAAPFRAFSGMASLTLHALGEGTSVIHCRIVEVLTKIAGNLVLVEVLELGFSGLYIASLLVSVGSTLWLWRRLGAHGLAWPRLPDAAFARAFLGATGFEAHRLLSAQLAVTFSLGLFAAARWPGSDLSRLDAYASGQTLILLFITPLAALTRYIAFRSAALPRSERDLLIRDVWRTGLPFVGLVGLVLFLGAEWLGRKIYGQHGPWWSVLVQALALSLPLRYTGSVTRAAMQAAGCFGTVAVADSAAAWLAALPLVALGLWTDSPTTTYASLVLPELLCLLWLLWRLQARRVSAPA